MDQLDIAIHNTAHNAVGGLDRLAQQMGVGAQVFRNKCNPNTDSHKLTLREALAMMHITGSVEMLEVMAGDLGYTIEPKVVKPGIDLMRAVLNSSAEYGDVSEAIIEALRDNKITAREAAEIRKQISETKASLDELLGSVVSIEQQQRAGQ